MFFGVGFPIEGFTVEGTVPLARGREALTRNVYFAKGKYAKYLRAKISSVSLKINMGALMEKLMKPLMMLLSDQHVPPREASASQKAVIRL